MTKLLLFGKVGGWNILLSCRRPHRSWHFYKWNTSLAWNNQNQHSTLIVKHLENLEYEVLIKKKKDLYYYYYWTNLMLVSITSTRMMNMFVKWILLYVQRIIQWKDLTINVLITAWPQSILVAPVVIQDSFDQFYWW